MSAIAAWDNLPPASDLIVPVIMQGDIVGVISRDAMMEYLIVHGDGAVLEEVYS
jgi:hypothetical protein